MSRAAPLAKVSLQLRSRAILRASVHSFRYMSQAVLPKPSLYAGVPRAGLRPGSWPPVSLFR